MLILPAEAPKGEQDLEVDPRLIAIFREVFGRPDMTLRRDQRPETVADWDSIHTMSILMSMEDRFGLMLRPTQIRALRSVGDIERLLPL